MRLQREGKGREPVAEGGKQIFVNTSSDVLAFPNACIQNTHTYGQRKNERHADIMYCAPFSGVISHSLQMAKKNANRPTATRRYHKETPYYGEKLKGICHKDAL